MTPRWGKGDPPARSAHAGPLRVRPWLWPLGASLSVPRTARHAARQHPERQGIVIAFTGAHADHLDVQVAGAAPVQLAGGRERPMFLALEPGTWSIHAGVAGATGYKHFTRYDVAVHGTRHRQIELVWFRVERFQLTCEITTIRPGTPHPWWDWGIATVGAC